MEATPSGCYEDSSPKRLETNANGLTKTQSGLIFQQLSSYHQLSYRDGPSEKAYDETYAFNYRKMTAVEDELEMS